MQMWENTLSCYTRRGGSYGLIRYSASVHENTSAHFTVVESGTSGWPAGGAERGRAGGVSDGLTPVPSRPLPPLLTPSLSLSRPVQRV